MTYSHTDNPALPDAAIRAKSFGSASCWSMQSRSSVGAATAAGVVNLQSFAAPYATKLQRFVLYSQMVSADTSGIVLSDARRTTIPIQNATTGHDAAYIWHSTNTTFANYVFYGGCLMARLSTK